MRPVSLIISISLLALSVISQLSVAASAVWKVESPSGTIYLAGTIHLLRQSDYPLPGEYQQALADSERLIFETDIAAINSPQTQQLILAALRAPERTLSSQLTPQTLSTLHSALAEHNLDLARFEHFKPAMLALTLQIATLAKLGIDSQGVDQHLYTQALTQGKALGQLESVEQQISLLANMGDDNAQHFIEQTLSELAHIEHYFDQIITAWRSGELTSLEQLLVEEYRSSYPAIYQSLIVDRNRNWLPQIEAQLAQSEKAFVLVGLAHLVGEDGLLNLLKLRGFKVSQL